MSIQKNNYHCKNYYLLTPEELDNTIEKIREWFLYHYGHPEYARVEFALDVALCAKELEKDDFVLAIIQALM
jgi:type II restriction/modification system DNA methylase subunit YeeA